MVICGQGADAARRQALEERGCDVVAVREVGGRIWLPAVLEALAERKTTRLLVEGGPAVWRSFAEAGFVDEVVVFRAITQIAGGQAIKPAIATLLPGLDLVQTAERRVGEDDMIRFRRRNRQP